MYTWVCVKRSAPFVCAPLVIELGTPGVMLASEKRKEAQEGGAWESPAWCWENESGEANSAEFIVVNIVTLISACPTSIAQHIQLVPVLLNKTLLINAVLWGKSLYSVSLK